MDWKTERKITEEIAPELLEDLRDLQDGSRITLAELVADSFYSDFFMGEEEQILLKRRLFSLGNRDPFRLEFFENGELIVHNHLAKYECPYCESINTGRILYGTCEITPRHQKKIDSGQIRMAGRDAVYGDADRYCNNCHKEFTVIPWEDLDERDEDYAPQIEFGNKLPDDLNRIESMVFHHNSWNDRIIHMNITRSRTGCRLICRERKYIEPYNKVTAGQISEQTWDNIIKTLYSKYRFHEWPEYEPQKLDGTTWRITIQFPDNFVQERRGDKDNLQFRDDLISLFGKIAD